jgi:hypothetical protein
VATRSFIVGTLQTGSNRIAWPFCSIANAFALFRHRYASLFFIVGTRNLDGQENTENELGMLEFIHNLVECMDKWAGSICELDVRTNTCRYVQLLNRSIDFTMPFSPTDDRPTNRSCTRYVTLFRSITVLCLFRSTIISDTASIDPSIYHQLESVHFLVDEMVQNGFVVETNKQNILRPIALMERESQKAESMFR